MAPPAGRQHSSWGPTFPVALITQSRWLQLVISSAYSFPSDLSSSSKTWNYIALTTVQITRGLKALRMLESLIWNGLVLLGQGTQEPHCSKTVCELLESEKTYLGNLGLQGCVILDKSHNCLSLSFPSFKWSGWVYLPWASTVRLWWDDVLRRNRKHAVYSAKKNALASPVLTEIVFQILPLHVNMGCFYCSSYGERLNSTLGQMMPSWLFNLNRNTPIFPFFLTLANLINLLLVHFNYMLLYTI